MKPYASYKPSGVAWLGDVPSHWASKRLKHIGQFRAGAGFPIEELTCPLQPYQSVGERSKGLQVN